MTQAPSPYPAPGPYRPSPMPSLNGLGLAGFIVSVGGVVLLMGVVCPIGALLSLIAVFRKPRGFAVAGLIVGVLGSVLWAVLWVLIIQAVSTSINRMQSYGLFWNAKNSIDMYYTDHNSLPDDATGNSLVSQHIDRWGQPFSYRQIDAHSCEIMSAGPDQAWGTKDDLSKLHWPHAIVSATAEFSFSGDAAAFTQMHWRIEDVYGDDGQAPVWHEVERLLINSYTDSWGHVIRYNAGEGRRYELRSAGEDGEMQTDDDIVFEYTLGEESPSDADVDVVSEPASSVPVNR